MNKLLPLSILFCLFSFSGTNHSSQSGFDLVGKWFDSSDGQYRNSNKKSFVGRWYTFKKNGKVEFSSCTDACRCLRVTYSGTWRWKNKNVLLINYDKVKRDRRGATRMNESRKEKLKIKRIDKNTLEISELRSEL
tara:strand:+ start:409 stop:813 length:405 start_codon:yes stop_codon:yes gene_type:complete